MTTWSTGLTYCWALGSTMLILPVPTLPSKASKLDQSFQPSRRHLNHVLMWASSSSKMASSEHHQAQSAVVGEIAAVGAGELAAVLSCCCCCYC